MLVENVIYYSYRTFKGESNVTHYVNNRSCGRRSCALFNQSLRANGPKNKSYLELGRRDRRNFMASVCLWSVVRPWHYSYWEVGKHA